VRTSQSAGADRADALFHTPFTGAGASSRQAVITPDLNSNKPDQSPQ
jgi:hypothetical protein